MKKQNKKKTLFVLHSLKLNSIPTLDRALEALHISLEIGDDPYAYLQLSPLGPLEEKVFGWSVDSGVVVRW